jgi:cellulase
VLTYIAPCNGNCSLVDKSKLEWIKIDQSGINYSTQVWASQVLINNNSTWTTKVPSKIAPGNYVFRHEIIAAHGSGSLDGAQNYPNCINIAITGGGTDKPTGTLGSALYKDTDPGIYFNPYTTITSYAMPGPTLYSS